MVFRLCCLLDWTRLIASNCVGSGSQTKYQDNTYIWGQSPYMGISVRILKVNFYLTIPILWDRTRNYSVAENYPVRIIPVPIDCHYKLCTIRSIFGILFPFIFNKISLLVNRNKMSRILLFMQIL